MNAHLTPDELRELFLFADLAPEQLEWIAGCGDVVEVPAGSNVVDEGEPSRCFYVLLSGTVSMSRVIGGETVETTRTDHRGSYFGAVQFYLQDDESAREYPASVRAITDCVVLALPAKEFAKRFAQWFPMAVHLLEGMLLGMRRGNQQLAERERLLALGKLSAGLTHELNNPAAAAIRATDALRDKVTGMRNKLAMIADGRIAGPALRKLVMAQDEFVKKVRHAPALSPLEASDRGGRAGRLVRRTRHRRRLGPRAGVRGGRAGRRGHGGRVRRVRERDGGGPDPLAGLHGREREPHARDHRRHHADLRPRRRGEAVLAARPGAVPLRRRPRGPRRHADDVRAQAGGGGRGEDRQRLRPLAPADPGLLGRAQPGVDEHHRQRARRHGRRGHAHRPHVRGSTTARSSRSATPAPASRRTSGGGSSSRSSPPRAWARAPAWAWTSATG